MQRGLLIIFSCFTLSLCAQLPGTIGQYSFNFSNPVPFGTLSVIPDETAYHNDIIPVGEFFAEEDRIDGSKHAIGFGSLEQIISNSHFIINQNQNSTEYQDLHSFSTSFWFMLVGSGPNGIPQSGKLTLFNLQGDNGEKVNLYLDYEDNTKLDLIYSDGANTLFDISSTSSIERSNWYHITVTMNFDGTCKLYVNGLLAGQTNADIQIPDNAKLIFGFDQAGNEAAEWMCVDDLHVLNRAITFSEVQQLQNLHLTTGNINPTLQKAIKIFPNPANTNRVTITVPQPNLDFQIEVLTTDGKLVRSEKNTKNLNVSTLSNGTYFVRVITEEGVGLTPLVVARWQD